MNISNLLYKKFSHLSDGEKQISLIARALIKKPDILILDEFLREINNPKTHNINKNVQEEVEALQAAEHEEEKKEKLEYVTKDELKKEMDNLAVELKEHIKKLMDHKKEEKMSEEVKEELSAAVEPIAHNPEEVSKKKINLLSQNKTLTTQDIVFNKLFNK